MRLTTTHYYIQGYYNTGEPTLHAVNVMTSYRHFRIIAESYRTLYEDFCIQEKTFPRTFQMWESTAEFGNSNSLRCVFDKYISNCTSVGFTPTFAELVSKTRSRSVMAEAVGETDRLN